MTTILIYISNWCDLKLLYMKYLILSLLFLLMINCTKQKDDVEKLRLSKVKITEHIFDFGNINKGDTVTYSFVIKNISERKFIIDTVGTSCGCTTTHFTRDSIGKNQIAKIDVQYISDNNSTGKISKSIVVSDNSESGFHTFYLKGEVQ